MSKITILPAEVANHIAAGEVIERPASVVKELVENALDAGATHITVEIGVGGKDYLRVTDDGCGMAPEDAILAFERHATSKITSTADLAAITTLGFRGEALPSIASVAKVKLLTRTHDAVVGTRIDIHGGAVLNVSESGAAPGTYLEVNELFYKTPARLKFLKAPATETGYITAIILEEALAHPQVGFTVKNNGREQMHVPANSDALQRIAGLFGRDVARELIEIRESAGGFELRGFIGAVTCHRNNRNYQKLFVNQRPVKDKTLSHAIFQAYDALIPKGRHPIAFLALTLPPELVDVNVHPTKMEIRFVYAQAMHDFVQHALRRTLSAPGKNVVNLIEGASLPVTPVPESHLQEEAFTEQITFAEMLSPEELPAFPSAPSFISPAELPIDETPQRIHATSPLKEHFRTQSAALPDIPTFSTQYLTTVAAVRRPGRFAAMKPLGQFYDTYVLVQDGADLCIIDQHAAHERIYYEHLQRQLQHQQLDVQQLLFPVSLELASREQAILEEYLPSLPQYGLEIEHFGGATYLLKAMPALMAHIDHKKFIYDLLDHLAEMEQSLTVEVVFDDVLKLMACHTAIRAHQPLQTAEIVGLLQQMDAAVHPYTCPHGRPTILKISVQELARKFGRS